MVSFWSCLWKEWFVLATLELSDGFGTWILHFESTWKRIVSRTWYQFFFPFIENVSFALSEMIGLFSELLLYFKWPFNIVKYIRFSWTMWNSHLLIWIWIKLALNLRTWSWFSKVYIMWSRTWRAIFSNWFSYLNILINRFSQCIQLSLVNLFHIMRTSVCIWRKFIHFFWTNKFIKN